MPFVLSPGDIVAVTAVCQDSEQISLNTFHYICDIESGLSASDNDFAEQWSTDLNGDFKAILNNNSTFNGVFAQKIWPLPIPSRQVDTADAGPGVAGATSLPRQTAGIISWHTDLAKQANRGRTYLPFPSATDNTLPGTPSVSYVSRATILANACQTFTVVNRTGGGGAIAVALVLYHRLTHTVTEITGRSVAQKWATVKKRGSFGKPNISPI
jgi:hypothetical protein